jgi:hypothetical protein
MTQLAAEPMLHDSKPYAKFILARLLKTLPEGYGARRAVSETEIPIEKDDWYWADDNAKVLALLTLPEIWRDHAEEVSDIARFVIWMCDGPLIFRRIGTPRFEVLGYADGVGRFRHSLMDVECDLANGHVSLGMRFHDGRTAKNVTLAGPHLQFSRRFRSHTIGFKDRKFHYDAEILPDRVRFLWWTSIEIEEGFFHKKTKHIGRITYTCTVRADSMFADIDATLDIADGVEISNAVIAFALDDLPHNRNNIRYEMLSVASHGAPPVVQKAKPSSTIEQDVSNATYWSIWQNSHMLGFASAIHTLPGDSSRFTHLRARSGPDGRLRRVISEHRFAGKQKGKIAVSERKVLTSGGLYQSVEFYADLIRRHAERAEKHPLPLDLSVSYDYGAEILAFARILRAIAGSENPEAHAQLRKETEAVLDRLFEAYDIYFMAPAKAGRPAVFSRSLAFVALARAEMFEVTGNRTHLSALREACDLIASFERPHRDANNRTQSGFLMGKETDSYPYVDCHASCLIALIRATELLNDLQWLEAIDRALSAYKMDKHTIGFCGKNYEYDLLCVEYFDKENTRKSLETFWNFKAGLSVSLFNALRAAHHQGIKSIWAKHAERIAPLEAHARDQIAQSIRPRDDALEIRCSVLSAETNSETQPWVALSLIGQ